MGLITTTKCTTWPERWMQLARTYASWSKDRSTKVGCVIVGDNNRQLSCGWNGFPRRLNDDVDSRHERPAKYAWTEHAERNAIYNAAAEGVSLDGATLYVTMFPCTDCVRGIIQVGITKLVCPKPDWDHPKYGEDFKIGKSMLEEARCSYYDHS